jgi:hypothetical protein
MTLTKKVNSGDGRFYNILNISIAVIYIGAVSFGAVLNIDQMNPDGVSYIRIAQYVLGGRTDLMISGYWSPLISWLMVPWLAVVEQPLQAARAILVLSAAVFLYGAWRVLAMSGLPAGVRTLGLALVAVVSLPWSMKYITPDLLAAGLLGWGSSLVLREGWSRGGKPAFIAGMVLGLAYLAKAVVLPVSFLIVMFTACTRYAVHKTAPRQLLSVMLVTFVGVLLVAGPWIGILSAKYGRPVFSTVGAIGHALVGPPHGQHQHFAFQNFHKPEPGRQTSLEDPSGHPYPYWSPFESRANALHQAKMMAWGVITAITAMSLFSWLGLGAICTLLAFAATRSWRTALAGDAWRWSAIPVAAIVIVYLPVYSTAARYFWATVPFLVVASLGFALSLAGPPRPPASAKRFAALGLVALSFLAGHDTVVRRAFIPVSDGRDDLVQRVLGPRANPPYEAAKMLAAKLAAAGLSGPVAGGGAVTAEYGLLSFYVAYVSGLPWYGGDLLAASAEEIFASGARIFVAPEESSVAQELRSNACFSVIATTAGDAPMASGRLRAVLFAVARNMEWADCRPVKTGAKRDRLPPSAGGCQLTGLPMAAAGQCR